MKSVTQLLEKAEHILNEEANELALSTGFLKRVRKLSGADFVQSLIFGWLESPTASLEELAQGFSRRSVSISASGLHQRFSQEAAELMQAILKRLSQLSMSAEPVPIPLLRRFSAVVIEDSSTISLPDQLSEVWRGCGGSKGTSQAALKLFVRWNVLDGEISGPELTNARSNDQSSPLKAQELPEGGLYLADLGFFSLAFLSHLDRGLPGKKRYFVSRMQGKTALYTKGGHRILLRGILPKHAGEVREMGVLLGHKIRLRVRLLMLKVSEEVAEQRREHIRVTAAKHGRLPNEELLYLAGWTLVVTNVPGSLLSVEEILVCLRLRWQIERLFRLWKEHGRIDEWRSSNPWRILCELYAKLCAMLLQQWLITDGCWHEPFRSLVKAASCVRREANRLMLAFFEGGLRRTWDCIASSLARCKIERRGKHPSTAQLLLEGLDWPIVLLT